MGTAEKTYVDPSALRRSYLHDDRSSAFCAWRRRLAGSLPLSLHGRAELVNSLMLAVFRGDIPSEAADGALADLEDDLRAGRLHIADLLWRRALERAEHLSRQHTPKLGTRSLDILHVASAQLLGCTTFVTYDDRQAALARTLQLRVVQP